MQITHKQARTLIQFSHDSILPSAERAALSSHLQDCDECQVYAQEIKDVERLLLPVMKRQWNVQPIPLSITALMGRSKRTTANNLLTIRKTAISLIMMVLFFSAWQYVVSGVPASGETALAIPPVPTPSVLSAQLTKTQLTREGCVMRLHTTQEHDTLASIARQFSVSEASIVKLNHLKVEVVPPGMELMILICNSTPTGTFHAATFTTTDTSIIGSMTSTPGG